MTYEYHCAACALSFDLIKSVREIDQTEYCTACGKAMVRAFAPRRVHFTGTAVQEKKWQPALGKAMTDKELAREAKSQGLIELGNEDPHKHVKEREIKYPDFTLQDIQDLSRKLEADGSVQKMAERREADAAKS